MQVVDESGHPYSQLQSSRPGCGAGHRFSAGFLVLQAGMSLISSSENLWVRSTDRYSLRYCLPGQWPYVGGECSITNSKQNKV